MSKTSLVIATRESPLALWQANWVKAQLEQNHPNLTVSLLGLTTRGDTIQDVPLLKVGGKSLFVKELEEALLDGRADLAVHSMKDVPADLPDGLYLPVMCEREDPRDAFVANNYSSLAALPQGAVVGTSSLRRQSQILSLRPDVITESLRGNVNTRLRYLDEGKFQAIILAAAGLKRLNCANRISAYLDMDQSLPAAGQGVLGLECRINDEQTRSLISALHHKNSFLCVTAERALTKRLNGGCHAPVAAFAEIRDQQLYLRGLVGTPDGEMILRAEMQGFHHQAEDIGIAVAELLIKQGALTILEALEKPS